MIPIKPTEQPDASITAALAANIQLDDSGSLALITSSFDPAGTLSRFRVTLIVQIESIDGKEFEFETELSAVEGSLAKNINRYDLGYCKPTEVSTAEIERPQPEPIAEISQEKIDRLNAAYEKLERGDLPITLSSLALGGRVQTDEVRAWAARYQPEIARLLPKRRQPRSKG